MKKKLKAVANHLLDLGKRNRLLNYKDTGLRSLSVLSDSYEKIFTNILDKKTYSIFMLDAVLNKFHNDLILDKDKDNVLDYSLNKVYDIANKLTKPNELLCYQKGYSLNNVLRNLYREYRFSIVEKGIDCLYICFGFIEYSENSQNYLAPLILIPIELIFDKGIYKIKAYDDDAIVNPTLKYFLKGEYNYTLLELEDDNLKNYLSSVEKSLPKKLKFKDGCAIGIFSFLKMNMYNDLMANTDIVLENKNICSILQQSPILNDETKEDAIYPVVNCDSSQLNAIKMASSGKSFVLQGPPGSGKSQTITNIIATLIANGKHVLFVSEKLAALKVVYENLRRVGLNEFAIELHSNKANKKDFIDSLYKTALLPKYDIKNEANDIIDKHYALKIRLKEYYEEIHQIDAKFQISLYDLISKALSLAHDDINYKIVDINNIDKPKLEKIINLLNEYKMYQSNIGYDYRNSVFYGINLISGDYIRYELKDDLENSIKILKTYSSVKNKLNKYLSIKINTVNDIYQSIDLVKAMNDLKEFYSFYFLKDERKELLGYFKDYFEIIPLLKTNILKIYKDIILKEDLEQLYLDYTRLLQKGKFFNSELKRLHKRILLFRNSKASYDEILKELPILIDYKKNLIKAKKILKLIKNHGLDDKSKYESIYNDLLSIKIDQDININQEEYKKLKPFLTDLLISFNSFSSDYEVIIKISKIFDANIFDLFNSSIAKALAKLEQIFIKLEEIDSYRLLLNTIKGLEDIGAIDYLNFYLKKSLPIEKLTLNYEYLFYKQYIYHLIDNSVILHSLTRLKLDNIIDEFNELDEKLFLINRDYIISMVSKKRPDDVLMEGSKFKILVTEANKLKRQKPIRQLLDEIFDLALDIKPVFLMSPLSVSTYLNSKANIFDYVIFDEASQVFAADALGAIYRAKQCIVIGDNKQMPPSNFFSSSQDDEELELESILDVATLSFTTSRLRWHYRSRNERLITFSNLNFYDNNLITIPQAKKDEEGFGIDFKYLKDARYDLDTRTNLIEAQTICDMVFKHFDSSTKSLGVVAFSDVQARLIEDLILKRLETKPQYKKYFQDECDEPFFVKNLESVQGDERDRIIFSICYGYNEKNKFYQRFGPLNNLGGERRLNVAITRAKYNITVVSSIKASDIKLGSTNSLGVKMLHDYLDYAETKNISLVNSNNQYDGLGLDVVNFLEQNGYKCYCNYGYSTFKIDIAVMKDNNFILAIMLDKTRSLKTNTTDRYRLEKLLLNRLGWNYYNIYSSAWFNYNFEEKNRLLDALKKTNEEKNITSIDTSYLEESNETVSDSIFKKYTYLDNGTAQQIYNDEGMTVLLNKLIACEQPIHEDYLYERVLQILDKKPSKVLKNLINHSLSEDIIKNGHFYMVDYNYSNVLRIDSSRSIDYISLDELKDGLLSIIKLNNGISIDNAYKNLIKVLGFNRVTDKTRAILNDVLVFLKLDGKVTERGNSLFI